MGDVLVLCYHAVSPTWSATFSVPPDTLDRQLTRLVRARVAGSDVQRRGARPSCRQDARGHLRRWLRLGPRRGRADSDRARPARDGVRARRVHVRRQHLHWQGIEAWLGTPYEDELCCMSWEDLGHLAERGWEIGSHTRSHRHLTTLPTRRCAMSCAARSSSAPATSGVLPLDRVSLRGSRRPGRGAGPGSGLPDRRLPGPQPGPARSHLWPRVGIWRDDSDLRFRVKVSRLTRSARASRMGPSLSRVYRRLHRRAPQT